MHFPGMSTLLEIEEAAETLPPAQKEELILFLTASLRGDAAPAAGKASDWLRSARGSVKLAAGETVDDARMEFYSGKYGVGR